MEVESDSGGVLLLLNMPQAMELGFDNTTWRVQSKFKGIKNIPMGAHYLYFSLPDEKHMFKSGRFIMFQRKHEIPIKVLTWDSSYQDFLKTTGSEETTAINAVKEGYYDCYLGGYPSDRVAIWQQSVWLITQEALDKLDPVQTMQKVQQEYTNKIEEKPQEQLNIDEEDEQPQVEEEQEEPDREVGKFTSITGSIFYSEVPKCLSGQSITSVNMDKTPLLDYMFSREYKNHKNIMLAQIQYAFVSFLLGESLESLEQWKKLINVVCFSESAFISSEHMDFLLTFIQVLFSQLKQLPKDFFIDQLSKQSFLVDCLRRLSEYKQETNSKMRNRINKLLELLRQHFGYEPPEEEDEPVIVDTHQNYL